MNSTLEGVDSKQFFRLDQDDSSNKQLISGHEIRERGDDFPGEEVEGQAEGDGERQGRKRSPEDGEEHEGEAEADQDGDEAGQRGVPVAVRGSLTDLQKHRRRR